MLGKKGTIASRFRNVMREGGVKMKRGDRKKRWTGKNLTNTAALDISN